METAVLNMVQHALPLLLAHPALTCDSDEEADVLYITFERAEATDSDLTNGDVVVRYQGDRIIGLTVLNASTQGASAPAK